MTPPPTPARARRPTSRPAARRRAVVTSHDTTRAMTPDDYARARRLLMRRDPRLGEVIKRVGPCGLADRLRADPFEALIRAIMWQQLSTKAAASIYAKVLSRFDGSGFPAPAAWLDIAEGRLREAGLSRQKLGYVRDLAEKVHTGVVALEHLHELSDEDVIRSLTVVKGIGRWSAEMFLMFRLHRPDVLPVDDLGIVRAMQRIYKLRKPVPKRLLRIGEAWRPYRSVASWYLWASADAVPVDAGTGSS